MFFGSPAIIIQKCKNQYEVGNDSHIFSKTFFLAQKWGKYAQNGPKVCFLKLIEIWAVFYCEFCL